jgi:hypothetical protein
MTVIDLNATDDSSTEAVILQLCLQSASRSTTLASSGGSPVRMTMSSALCQTCQPFQAF